MKNIFRKNGKITIYTGPMYSGKSTLLIDKALKTNNKLIFKPYIDDRTTTIYSRNNKELQAQPLKTFEEIIRYIPANKKNLNIFVDEFQFFGDGDEKIIEVVDQLTSAGHNLYISGLDTDFKKDKFGSILALKNMSSKYIELKAWCSNCKEDAHFTIRLLNGEPAPLDMPVIVVDNFGKGEVTYGAACSECHPVKDK